MLENDNDFFFEEPISPKERSKTKTKGKGQTNDKTTGDGSESDSSDDDVYSYIEPAKVKKPTKHVSFAKEPEIRYFSNLLAELNKECGY